MVSSAICRVLGERVLPEMRQARTTPATGQIIGVLHFKVFIIFANFRSTSVSCRQVEEGGGIRVGMCIA